LNVNEAAPSSAMTDEGPASSTFTDEGAASLNLNY
jgi:hypothetical protein